MAWLRFRVQRAGVPQPQPAPPLDKKERISDRLAKKRADLASDHLRI
jgi:hypothetical protein